MGDDHDRYAPFAAQPVQQAQDPGLDGDVERRRRLVRDQQPGLAGQRHGDGDPLSHAARELVRVRSQRRFRVGDPHRVEHLDGALAGLFFRKAEVRPNVLGHLDVDPEHRMQRGRRVLRNERDLLAPDLAELAALQPEQLPPLEADAARRPGPSGSRPSSDRAVSVLPEPLSPAMPRISPSPTENEMPSTARRIPREVRSATVEVVDLEHGAHAHLRIIRAVRGSSMSRRRRRGS